MRLAIPHATSTATIESLQLQTAFTVIRILTSWRAFNARCLSSAFDQNETSTEFPNAGQTEFPNALEIPACKLFT